MISSPSRMVVLVARLLLLLSVLLAVSQAQSQAGGECGRFRQESCQARGSQVLAVVSGVQSALECQVV